MRAVRFLPLVILLAAAGCFTTAPSRTPPRPTIPALADVDNVRIESRINQSSPIDARIIRQADMSAVLDWLKEIDFSPDKAQDLSGIGLAEIGQVTLTLRNGMTVFFGLSGGSVIVDRWLWAADTDKLTEIARRAGAK